MKIEVEIGNVDLPPNMVMAEYRVAMFGEQILSLGRVAPVRIEETRSEVIVFCTWVFPDFIKDGWWIAMDSCGVWYVFDAEPVMSANTFEPDRRGMYTVNISSFNWTPPPCSDWRASKMQKPSDKGGAR